MGNPLDNSTGSRINSKATARRQAKADAGRESTFVDNYLRLFGGPGVNQNFQSSLSGYYNGAPIDQIAGQLAKTNTYKPKVAAVKTKGDDMGAMGKLWKINSGGVF